MIGMYRHCNHCRLPEHQQTHRVYVVGHVRLNLDRDSHPWPCVFCPPGEQGRQRVESEPGESEAAA